MSPSWLHQQYYNLIFQKDFSSFRNGLFWSHNCVRSIMTLYNFVMKIYYDYIYVIMSAYNTD